MRELTSTGTLQNPNETIGSFHQSCVAIPLKKRGKNLRVLRSKDKKVSKISSDCFYLFDSLKNINIFPLK
jgi:hypothetical protein